MSTPRFIHGSLLVAGTAIGAGMLALPISTAPGGFWPAVVLYILCFLFTILTGFLLVEACSWMPKDSNLVSMSKHLLGKAGTVWSWILYLFLFYSLTIAYISGGAQLFRGWFAEIGVVGSTLLFSVAFGAVVLLGHSIVGRVNTLFMGGLVASFIGFILFSFDKISFGFLNEHNWSLAFPALPILFTSFSFQGLVPSLYSYTRHNAKLTRKCIFWGSLIPLLCYILWEIAVFGLVPFHGVGGLLEAKSLGESAIIPLQKVLKLGWISTFGQFFGFCALTTSFLGVTLGLKDFLSDGLKLKKAALDQFIAWFIVIIPPTCIVLINPNLFLSALHAAGGIGCALLLGLTPILMVWRGRFLKGHSFHNISLLKSRSTLILLVAFVIFELYFEFCG